MYFLFVIIIIDSVSYFVQLAVCHGLVAKLPSNLLMDLEVEGSSTSVLLFLLPLISKLSERYVLKGCGV